MPRIGPTPRRRSSPGSGRDSFAGARLLLAVDRRSRLCPSRRASGRARATSRRRLALLDRAAVPLADARGPVRDPDDRRPLADLARACRRDLARLAGRADVPSPPIRAGLSCRAEGATRRGEPSAARRGGGLPLPRECRRAAERERAGTVAVVVPPVSTEDGAPPLGIKGRLANQLVPLGARGGVATRIGLPGGCRPVSSTAVILPTQYGEK